MLEIIVVIIDVVKLKNDVDKPKKKHNLKIEIKLFSMSLFSKTISREKHKLLINIKINCNLL